MKEYLEVLEISVIVVIIAIFIVFIILLIFSNNKNKDKTSNENSTKEKDIITELRSITITDKDTCKFNYDLIEPSIFKEYVYKYEYLGGLNRKTSIKKALEDYSRHYNIYA